MRLNLPAVEIFNDFR